MSNYSSLLSTSRIGLEMTHQDLKYKPTTPVYLLGLAGKVPFFKKQLPKFIFALLIRSVLKTAPIHIEFPEFLL
jgi:hypothetical protein